MDWRERLMLNRPHQEERQPAEVSTAVTAEHFTGTSAENHPRTITENRPDTAKPAAGQSGVAGQPQAATRTEYGRERPEPSRKVPDSAADGKSGDRAQLSDALSPQADPFAATGSPHPEPDAAAVTGPLRTIRYPQAAQYGRASRPRAFPENGPKPLRRALRHTATRRPKTRSRPGLLRENGRNITATGRSLWIRRTV